LTESQTGNDNGTQPKHPKLSPTQEAGITAAVVDVLTETAQTKPIKFKKIQKKVAKKLGLDQIQTEMQAPFLQALADSGCLVVPQPSMAKIS